MIKRTRIPHVGHIEAFPGGTNITLEALMRTISGACDFFMAKNGCVTAMYHVVTRDGWHMVIDPPGKDKDAEIKRVRIFFRVIDAICYGFCDEAWISTYGEHPTEAELAVLPEERPNRREVVLIQGESEREGEMTGIRDIIRTSDAKPKLGPLELERWTEGFGRMVAMLPRRTTVQ